MNEPKCRSRIHVIHYVWSSYAEKQAYFERQYMKFFGWANSCTEAVLITDEFNDNLISSASYVYDPYSIQIDSKPSVKTQIS